MGNYTNGLLCNYAEWTEQDVVEKYLRPTNMEHLAKLFVENKINGAVLLALEERWAPGIT